MYFAHELAPGLMGRRTAFASGVLFTSALLVLAFGFSMSAFAEQSCVPAHIAKSQSSLPDAWRLALDELIISASGEGQPWDCSGADLELVLHDGRAELDVRLPDGRRASRPLDYPDLVVPVGEALLARPVDEASRATTGEKRGASSPSTSPRQDSPRAPSPALPTNGTHDPRLLIDAAFVGRVSAAVDAFWTGASLRVIVPYGDWSGGAWVRVDVPAKIFQPVSTHFTMNEVCVGLALGYRILRAPFELRLSGDVSFGVVSMDSGSESVERGETGEGSNADFRTGFDLQAAVPFSHIGRFLVGGDFEITPARFAGRHLVTPQLPELPGFSAGLSVGLGVGIP